MSPAARSPRRQESTCHELFELLVREDRSPSAIAAAWDVRTSRVERRASACFAAATGLPQGSDHVAGLDLWRYVEGRPELGAAGRRSTAEHLDACEGCREARARLIVLLGMLRADGGNLRPWLVAGRRRRPPARGR